MTSHSARLALALLLLLPLALAASEVAATGAGDLAGRLRSGAIAAASSDEAALETELAAIRALASEIASADPERPVPVTPAGSAREALADQCAAARREIFLARFREAVADHSAGRFPVARGKFLALHDDFPWAGKPVYFALLCLRDDGRAGAALPAARELRELLEHRARRDALRAELDRLAADASPDGPSPAARGGDAGRLKAAFAKIRELRPDLGDLPRVPDPPKAGAGDPVDLLKAWARHYRVADAREGLAEARALLRAGKIPEAFAAFDAVRSAHPGNLRAVYGMAECMRASADMKAAADIAVDLLALLRTRRARTEGLDELNEALATVDPGSTGTPEPGGGISFRIASFNILHGTDAAWEERLARSVRVLKAEAVDIVGFQEMRENQMRRFMKGDMGGDIYDIYPPVYKGAGKGFTSANSIAWNRARFELVKAEELDFKYFYGKTRRFPQLLLRDRGTGRRFLVLNTHDPAHPEFARERFENAHRYARHLDRLAAEGLPVFFTGDFNSGYRVRTEGNTTWGGRRENLTYCILTRSGKYRDAYDAARNRHGEGPSSDNQNSVDHIFLSAGVKVSRYWKVEGGRKKNGSDVHDTILAAVTVPADPR